MAATVREVRQPVHEARVALAAVHRLAARFGFDDGIWNHFTLELPGRPDRFLVKAHGLLMSEVCAGNLLVVDASGAVVEGEGRVERSAFCIHSRIHATHPRARCVLHAHPPHATWLADVAGGRLEMADQDMLRFHRRVAYDDDYQGAALETDEGERIARAFDGRAVLVSRNHGITVAGPSVAEAFYDLYYFERACLRQYLLDSGGRPASIVPEATVEHTAAQLGAEDPEAAALFFAALERTLEREGSDHAR